MEQFVLVPASVYNKRLITQSVTKQELPKYQPLQNPTYHIDSLKKEMNKKFVFQSRLFSRQDFVLSTYQALNFTNFIFRWCRNWNSPVGLCSTTASLKRRVPDIYLTLLDAACISPTLILNQNAKARERERKLGPFQNLNVRSCKGCTHRVVLLMGLCTT